MSYLLEVPGRGMLGRCGGAVDEVLGLACGVARQPPESVGGLQAALRRQWLTFSARFGHSRWAGRRIGRGAGFDSGLGRPARCDEHEDAHREAVRDASHRVALGRTRTIVRRLG